MRVRSRLLHWSLRLGQFAFSLVFVGCAIVATILMHQSKDSLDATLRKLTPLSRGELLATQPDAASLIEGRISAGNEVLAHTMVAYERTRAVRDIRNDTVWVFESRQAPSIVVDLADGPVQIHGDYVLGGNLHTQTDGAVRYAGLKPGDPVVVIGKHMPGAAVVRIDATYVLRGTRAELLQSRVNYWGLGVGGAFLALGLGIMAWLLRQGYSPFGKRSTGRT